MSTLPEVAKKPSQVELSLTNLTDEISRLEKNLGDLSVRLNPVLCFSITVTGSKEPVTEAPKRCELATKISETGSRVNHLNFRLTEMLESLEL